MKLKLKLSYILSFFLLLSLIVNLCYMQSIKKLKNVERVESAMSDSIISHLNLYLARMNNALYGIEYNDDPEVIENEYFNLAFNGSKLTAVLEISYGNNADLLRIYMAVNRFNDILLTHEGRNFILQNRDSLISAIEELIMYSLEIDSKQFKESLGKFEDITQSYYGTFHIEING